MKRNLYTPVSKANFGTTDKMKRTIHCKKNILSLLITIDTFNAAFEATH